MYFMTLREVAQAAGLSEARVYQLQGELQAFRIAGRLVADRALVEQFIERRRLDQTSVAGR